MAREMILNGLPIGVGLERLYDTDDVYRASCELGKLIAGDALTAITVAGSGHTGGALSSSTIFGTMAAMGIPHLYDRSFPHDDKLVVAGHYAGSAFAFLGRMGGFDIEDFYSGFRRGTAFEGHVTAGVRGISWGTGRLGQELSAACGHALQSKIAGYDNRVYCVTTDGGKQEGQGDEARRFAAHFGLDKLIEVMDFNHTQISGNVRYVMHQNYVGEYEAAGWDVYEIDGHDPLAIRSALTHARVNLNNKPKFILADTKFAHGVSFMQEGSGYHGKAPSIDEYVCATTKEIGLEPLNIAKLRERDASKIVVPAPPVACLRKTMVVRPSKIYTEPVECRTAIGEALLDLGKLNKEIMVVDADLGKSTKMELFEKEFSNEKRFIQCGVAEQNAMTIAGVLGTYPSNNVFISGFSTFILGMTLSQIEMNLYNDTNLTIIGTHQGLDVGEDGKTHQCLNYLGLANSLRGAGLKAVFPADGNQARRVIESDSIGSGMTYVGVGRSKVPPIKTPSGELYYGPGYSFNYGDHDVLRQHVGAAATILTYGNTVGNSVAASDILLKEKGLYVNVVNVSCPLNIDRAALERVLMRRPVFTVEDHYVSSGLGPLVGANIGARPKPIGVLDKPTFQRSDSPRKLYERAGLLAPQIAETVASQIRR